MCMLTKEGGVCWINVARSMYVKVLACEDRFQDQLSLVTIQLQPIKREWCMDNSFGVNLLELQ
jgi:hypothetical protein